jgi:hypothetical protein
MAGLTKDNKKKGFNDRVNGREYLPTFQKTCVENWTYCGGSILA